MDQKKLEPVFYGDSWVASCRRELYKKCHQLLIKPLTKKIITIDGLINQLNIGWANSDKLVVYYYTPYFETFLKILKQEGFIYDFKISAFDQIISNAFSIYKASKYFRPMVIIYLQTTPQNKQDNFILLVSKTTRRRYGSQEQLLELLNYSSSANSLYVISTVQGLLTLKDAVHLHLGGEILCRVN